MKSNFNLKDYGTMAATLLASLPVAAQVTYTDFDPDIVVSDETQTFELDIDEDGWIDLYIEKASNTFSLSSVNRDMVVFYLFAPGASVAGINPVSSVYGTFPYAFQFGSLIDNSDEFGDFSQILLYWTDIQDSVFAPVAEGYWFNSDWSPVIDHYLGIKFQATVGIFKYGWIRCSIIDSGQTLIIHDYAIEQQPNYPIEAGSIDSYVQVTDQSASNDIKAFYSGNMLTIQNSGNTNPYVHIYDVNGKSIFNTSLTTPETHIDVSTWPKGVYLISAKDNLNLRVTKFFIY